MGVTKRFNSDIKRRAGGERARRVLACCNRFLIGDFHGLYEHVMSTAASELHAHSIRTQNTADTKSLNRVERLAKKGQLRRAVAECNAVPSPPADDVAFERLTPKFPLTEPEPELGALLEKLPVGAWDDAKWNEALGAKDPSGEGNPAAALMAHVITKLPLESGKGPSGTSFEFIMCIGNVNAKLVWDIILHILRGRCPKEMCGAFASARLVACPKKAQTNSDQSRLAKRGAKSLGR